MLAPRRRRRVRSRRTSAPQAESARERARGGAAAPWRSTQVEMSSQQFPRLGTPSTGLSQAPSQIANSGSAGLINPAATVVNDESSREAEVTAREHMGSSSSLQSREEKQEPVVVRPYPQVQMLSTHHAVASGTPVTVTAPPAHLTPAVPLSFSEGLMKVMERFKISH